MTAIAVVETKTARRKRERAERAASAQHEINRAAQKAAERIVHKLILRLCSPWWAEHVAKGGAYLPASECACRLCRRQRKWPSPCVSARALSFECHVLATAPPARDERWRRVSHAEAASVGLHIVRRRVGEHKDHDGKIRVMIAGCERCEGLREQGEKYCVGCRAVVVREMEEAGYL